MSLTEHDDKKRMTFDERKDAVIEKVILHVRYPLKFPPVLLTHEEIAVLWAKDEDDLLTKMAICKMEQRTLKKIRKLLFERFKIKDFTDVYGESANSHAAAVFGVDI